MSVEAELMGVAETLELAVLAAHAEWFAVIQAAMEVREVMTTTRGKARRGKPGNARPLSPCNEAQF
jgi:hypothetical protein